jgi:hypothetical protein
MLRPPDVEIGRLGRPLRRRRSTIDPVIGHPKNEHRMDCNDLHHRRGDANNAILAAVGYNFRLWRRQPDANRPSGRECATTATCRCEPAAFAFRCGAGRCAIQNGKPVCR